jgi:hypothetical protein
LSCTSAGSSSESGTSPRSTPAPTWTPDGHSWAGLDLVWEPEAGDAVSYSFTTRDGEPAGPYRYDVVRTSDVGTEGTPEAHTNLFIQHDACSSALDTGAPTAESSDRPPLFNLSAVIDDPCVNAEGLSCDFSFHDFLVDDDECADPEDQRKCLSVPWYDTSDIHADASIDGILSGKLVCFDDGGNGVFVGLLSVEGTFQVFE